jgi:hypothetical protein
VAIEGEENSQIVVVGDNIDSVNLTYLLRKKVGFAECRGSFFFFLVHGRPSPKPQKFVKGPKPIKPSGPR